MTTHKQTVTRSELVRTRRSKPKPRQPVQTARGTFSGNVFLPVEPRPAVRQAERKTTPRFSKQGRKAAGPQRYDIAFSMANARVRTPGIAIPQFGPRWISAALTLVLGIGIYLMLTSSTFIVTGAEIIGNQRLSATELDAFLGMSGRSIFMAVPAQIEENMRSNYHDLSDVEVRVALPNRLVVELVERVPVMAWYHDNTSVMIDAEGVAFPSRGSVQGLIYVAATGSPPQAQITDGTPVYEQPYVTADMVQALRTLAPLAPPEMPILYDAQYGMGWQDPRGWQVFFGQNTDDIPMKIKVYEAIAATLTLQGIQPEMINVAYLEAPFYK